MVPCSLSSLIQVSGSLILIFKKSVFTHLLKRWNIWMWLHQNEVFEFISGSRELIITYHIWMGYIIKTFPEVRGKIPHYKWCIPQLQSTWLPQRHLCNTLVAQSIYLILVGHFCCLLWLCLSKMTFNYAFYFSKITIHVVLWERVQFVHKTYSWTTCLYKCYRDFTPSFDLEPQVPAYCLGKELWEM